MISAMKTATRGLDVPHQNQTNRRGELALTRVLNRFSELGDLKWRGRPPSDSAIITASWLWMEDLPFEFLEAVIRQYLVRLETIVNEGRDPGGFDGGLPPGFTLSRADAEPEPSEPRGVTDLAEKPLHVARAESRRARSKRSASTPTRKDR